MSVNKKFYLILNGYYYLYEEKYKDDNTKEINKDNNEESLIISTIDDNIIHNTHFILPIKLEKYDNIDELTNFINTQILTFNYTQQIITFDYTYNFMKFIMPFYSEYNTTMKVVLKKKNKILIQQNAYNLTLYDSQPINYKNYNNIVIELLTKPIYDILLNNINLELSDKFNLLKFCNNYLLYINQNYRYIYNKKKSNINKKTNSLILKEIIDIITKFRDSNQSIESNTPYYYMSNLFDIYKEYSTNFTDTYNYLNILLNRYYPDIHNNNNLFTLCNNILKNTKSSFDLQQLKNIQYFQFLIKPIEEFIIYYNDPQNVFSYTQSYEEYTNYFNIVKYDNNEYAIELTNVSDKKIIGRLLTFYTYFDKQINTQKIINILSNTQQDNINNFIKCDKWYNHLRYLMYLYDFNCYKYNKPLNYHFEYNEIKDINMYNNMIKLFYPKYKKIFTNLNKYLDSKKSFIITFYKYDNDDFTIYKYKINYNILTEGDLIDICVLRIKQLLEFIYPTLKNVLYEDVFNNYNIAGNKNIPFINTEMIIKYLLPYINNSSFADIHNIESLDELYSSIDENNNYKFTNYNCDHTLSLSNGEIKKYKFNLDDFILNANSIFKTIVLTENKLFINWNNVFPYIHSFELLKDTEYYKRHIYLPCKNELFYNTDNLQLLIPYEEKTNKIINKFVDIEAIEFLTNCEFHILESSIDDLLFLNNTMNEFYNYFNNNIKLPVKWYNILPEEKEHYLKILFKNEIDNTIFDINDKLYYSHINLMFEINKNETNDIYKYTLHQETINDILINNVNSLYKRGILSDIIIQYNIADEITAVNSKDKYNKYIQHIMYNFSNLPNDKTENTRILKTSFKYMIIKLCEEAYYFFPIYFCLNKYDELRDLINYKKYTYIQLKYLPLEINLKFIADITELYNKRSTEKVEYSQLFTYIYRILYKYKNELNIIQLKYNEILCDVNILHFNNIKNKILELPNNDDNILNLCKYLIQQYEIKKNEYDVEVIKQKNNEDIKNDEQPINISPYVKIVDDYNNFIEHLDNIFKNSLKYNSSYLINDFDKHYKLNDNFYNDNNQYITQFYWNTFFSLYYLEQINIFNKFLNNRIIYATGSTGTGKSTQLPKLLLYAGIVFDNNLNYNILCSQPRQKPTADNAIIISKQLSIPLFKSELTEINNIEYFIQYKHGKDNHLSSYINYPTLIFQTDKIVYNNVLNNPLCCNNKLILPQEELNINQKYNIIIVDEAHEHNINMDLILSVMKQYCFYNNDLKLVIISATMDNDEPNYRKFYDNINDLITPYNLHTLYSNDFLISRNLNYNKYQLQNTELTNDEKQLLYPVIDKRLDISEPLQTTIYKIEDIYKNLDDEQLRDENYKNTIILDIIKEELKDSYTKDILVFKYGRTPIEKFINQTLMSLPSDVLILPFYSELKDEIKEYIGNISKHRNEITINKEDILDISKLNDISIFNSGKSKYNHFIIVATNIAEASITIDSLNVVIDDGIQNINIYDKQFNSYELRRELIAETNRLQRRGRVGRTSNGKVYYLYKKDYLLDKKQYYNICINNISNEIIPLISFNYNKEFDTLLNDLILCSNYYKTNYDYILSNDKSIFSYNEHFLKTINEYNTLLNVNLEFKNNVNYDNLDYNKMITEKETKDKNNIISYKYKFNKSENNYLDKKNYGIFYPIKHKDKLDISNIKQINLIVLTNIIEPSVIELDNKVMNIADIKYNFKCKHNLLLNRLIHYNNLSDDNIIKKYSSQDGINYTIDKFVQSFKYDNVIIWLDSYNLNMKYCNYIKIEKQKYFDLYKKLYDNVKLIFKPLLIYDDKNKTNVIKYNFGVYSDVLLNVNYNFFNISYNELNLTRDMFYNIVYDKQPLNLSKNIINTYKSLQLIDIDDNNNIIILSTYYLLYELYMNINIQSNKISNDMALLLILGIILSINYNCAELYIINIVLILFYDEIINELTKNKKKIITKYDDELLFLINIYTNQYMLNKLSNSLFTKIKKNIIALTNIFIKQENKDINLIINKLSNIYSNYNIINITKKITKQEKVDLILTSLLKNNIIVNVLNENLTMYKDTFIISNQTDNSLKKYKQIHLYVNAFYPKYNVYKYVNQNTFINETSMYYIYFYDEIQVIDNIRKVSKMRLLHKINPEYLQNLNIDIIRLKEQINKYTSIDYKYANTLENIVNIIENK